MNYNAHSIFQLFSIAVAVVLEPLVCHVAHGSQLVVSPLILSSRQTCSAASWCPVQWSSGDSHSRTWCLGAAPPCVGRWETKSLCVCCLACCTVLLYVIQAASRRTLILWCSWICLGVPLSHVFYILKRRTFLDLLWLNYDLILLVIQSTLSWTLLHSITRLKRFQRQATDWTSILCQ